MSRTDRFPGHGGVAGSVLVLGHYTELVLLTDGEATDSAGRAGDEAANLGP